MNPPRRRGFAADLTTTPNLITLSRIALCIAGGALFFAGWNALGIILCIVAGITDYLDGYVARRTGQVTRLGEILDQFCDVFFESLILFVALAIYRFLPPWLMLVYLTREMWMTSIRRFMAEHQMNIPSNIFGKLKSNFLCWGGLPVFLSISGYFPQLEPALATLGRVGIITGMCLGYYSAWGYTRQFVIGYDTLMARTTTVARPAATHEAGPDAPGVRDATT
jgi:CDP-diacylglycerol--glycerol-3-phosphate 3-phosphatidyltransferase